MNIGGSQFIQTWYAIASAPLSSDSISVVSQSSGETWYGVVAFGVSGANLQAPFDPLSGLPKLQNNINCPQSDPCNTGVSTSANDLVFQFGGDTGYTTQTVGTGFTLIQANAVGQDAYAQYEIASSPLSSATLSFGTSQVSDFGVIADAIQGGVSAQLHPTTSSVTPNPSSVTEGGAITFTVTVSDTSASPTSPTGTETWNDGGFGGSFGGSSQCTLSSLGPSSSDCSITYTAPSSPGPATITAVYPGDSTHSGSSGSSALTVLSTSGGGDWPSFTLNMQNSRYQANSTVTSANVGSLSPQWSITTPYSVTSNPVVLNGNVYFADWGGDVYSASVATGHTNWQVNLGHPISSTLALANGMVYVGMGPVNTTQVLALSQADGHIVWNTTLKTSMDAVWSSPIIYNGLLYIGVSSSGDESNASWIGSLFALNANTGAVAWKFNTAIGSAGGDGVTGSIAIDPSLNSIYFGVGNPYGSGSGASLLYGYCVMSLDATTGTLNWYTPVFTTTEAGQDLDFISTPNLFSVSIGGTVYNALGIGNKNGTYYVFNRTNGNLLEQVQIDSKFDGAGIIGLAAYAYLSSNNPEIFVPADYNGEGIVGAYTPSSNGVQWSYVTPAEVVGSVTAVPGAVIFGDQNGNLYAFSDSGSKLFSIGLPSGIYGGISVAEGHVFVPTAFGSTDGVYAYAPSSTSLSLDGSGSCSNGSSPQCSIALATTTAKDLIYVQETSQAGHETAPPTDTAGLTYTLRASEVSIGSDEYTSIWTAQWPGSGTDTITCNADNANARIGCIAVAVAGVNTNSPFDNNPSVPCAASAISSFPSCTLSTNNAAVMILGFSTFGCGVSPVPDSGYAIVQSLTGCNGNSAVEYRVVSSTQTNLSVGLIMSAPTEWILLGDAVVAAS